MKSCLAPLLCIPIFAIAQSAMPTEFPADATIPTASDLRARLAGKAFIVKPASGPSWRLDYKENGFVFLNVSTGRADKGQWRVEDGKLCSEWTKVPSGCSETRMHGDSVYLKRSSTGEVVVLVAD